MSSVILSDNDSPIAQPYDKYWDGPMSRREAHRLFMKLAANDSELAAMCDTAALVVNFLCEKASITREEIQTFVDIKSSQVAAMREQMKKAQE
jgi:hypothetical protein